MNWLFGCRIKLCIQQALPLRIWVKTQGDMLKIGTQKVVFFILGSGVRQKYALWVLVGCEIKFCIQWALSLEIWVKIQGDMSKIRAKQVVFYYDKYVNSTIMVDSFYWNSISSWIPTHKIYCSRVFL